jgi:hypothetical protein
MVRFVPQVNRWRWFRPGSVKGPRGRVYDLLLVVAATTTALAAGCGSNGITGSQGKGGSGPIAGENTQVTLVLSSTANDALAQFDLFLNSLTLTNKAGKTVTLLSSPGQAEFIHLNDAAEPFVTVSVPQDVYTSATATVGAASFDCEVLQSKSITSSTYAYGATPKDQVTVNLPNDLTVDGASMALSMQLQVSQSATFPSQCYVQGIIQYSITPTFTLAPMTLAAQPTNWTNGKFTALEGVVASVDGTANRLSVNPADGAGYELTSGNATSTAAVVWNVSTESSTVFQGIGNLGGITAGMAVDFDAELQPDGSLLATRVAVPDQDTTDLTVVSGPVIEVVASSPVMTALGRQTEGVLGHGIGSQDFSFGNATFQTWSGMANVAQLPFSASFSRSNMVPGQVVSITSHVTTVQGGPVYVPVATMTLMPQTIDGTVTAMGTSGSFTTYTVMLAPYDIFPMFAVLPGQANLIANPLQVVVYANTDTQVLRTAAAGDLARFTGLMFNDNGTLRMDCLEVSAGVAE